MMRHSNEIEPKSKQMREYKKKTGTALRKTHEGKEDVQRLLRVVRKDDKDDGHYREKIIIIQTRE